MAQISKYKGIIQIGSIIISVMGIMSIFYWNNQSSLGAEIKDIRIGGNTNSTQIAELREAVNTIKEDGREIKSDIKLILQKLK